MYTHLAATESTALGWSVPCVDTVPDLQPREPLTIAVRSVDLLGRAGGWSEPLVASARAEEPGGCATGGGPAGSLVLVGLSLGGLLLRTFGKIPNAAAKAPGLAKCLSPLCE